MIWAAHLRGSDVGGLPGSECRYASGEALDGALIATVQGDGTWEIARKGLLSVGSMRAPSVLVAGRRGGPAAATVAAAVALRECAEAALWDGWGVDPT